MSTPVKIVGILTALPGKAEELQALVLDLQAASRAETDNLRWDIWRDQADPDRLLLDELYASQDDVAAHVGTQHFKNYAGKVKDLAERVTADPQPSQRQLKIGDVR